MTDKTIKVGDRVQLFGRTAAAEVRAVVDDRAMVRLPNGNYEAWHVDNCTRLPRTRKVERWAFECRDRGVTWTGTAHTEDGANKDPYRISAPVRVELEVEET